MEGKYNDNKDLPQKLRNCFISIQLLCFITFLMKCNLKTLRRKDLSNIFIQLDWRKSDLHVNYLRLLGNKIRCQSIWPPFMDDWRLLVPRKS